MSVVLRCTLIIVSFLTFMYIIRKTRQSKLKIDYAIFWFLFAILMLLLSVFPQIAIMAAELIGLVSPANLVFLAIIFILLIKSFRLTLYVSKLDDKITKLTQHIALKEYEDPNNEES